MVAVVIKLFTWRESAIDKQYSRTSSRMTFVCLEVKAIGKGASDLSPEYYRRVLSRI
jgi:hypothetical protein